MQTIRPSARIAAERTMPAATAQLLEIAPFGPHENLLGGQDSYRIDLGLAPRALGTRGRYQRHWHPQHFEALGSVFVLPPGEDLLIRGEGGPAQTIVLCHLRPQAMARMIDGDLHWSAAQLGSLLDIQQAGIRRLMLRLARELQSPGLASEAMAELIVGELAIELGRHCRNLGQTDGASGGGLSAWRLRRIDQRLRDDPMAPSLSELAALCHLSVRQLSRGFLASRGVSIGQHIIDVRLQHARGLLATDESVGNIAKRLGFGSSSNFIVAFRRASQQTPNEYRRSLARRDSTGNQ